jgi:tellurite methyltransferase
MGLFLLQVFLTALHFVLEFTVDILSGYLPTWAIGFDIGCGTGKDAIFLAKQWFNVDGVDIDINNINLAKKLVWSERQRCAFYNDDIRKIHLINRYDFFVCKKVLHFLSQKDACHVVSKMQNATSTNWYNAISFFTSDTPHKPLYFFPKLQELAILYQGWVTLFVSEIIEHKPSLKTNYRPMYEQKVIFKKWR